MCKVITPSGVQNVFFTFDTKEDVVNKFLNYWAGYCEKNWLSKTEKNGYSSETTTKLMLSGIASVLLYKNMEGILTRYKEKKQKNNEILESSLSIKTAEPLKTNPPKKWMLKNKERDGLVYVGAARVNTDNEFVFLDKKYTLSSKLEKYGYQKLKDGEHFYKFDTVYINKDKYGNFHFFDHENEKIDEKYIKTQVLL